MKKQKKNHSSSLDENLKIKKKLTNKIIKKLKKEFPDVKCALNFENPLELLIATILSAQCTDKRVNIVTKKLFATYKTPKEYANAPLSHIEKLIYSTGFYRNKAKSIQESCQRIHHDFQDKVPKNMKDLLSLRGVARKTANVVLGNGFGKNEGIVVDTHVKRIATRLSLVQEKTPEKIEQELIQLVPKKEWTFFSHLIIHHGRKTCIARKPKCLDCPLIKECPGIIG